MHPFTRLLDLLCPPTCPLCGESQEEFRPFCEKCEEQLATPDGEFCPRCGGRRFQRTRNEKIDACKRCRTTDFRFRRVIALGEYERELRKLVLRMKTERSGLSARAAVELLWKYRESGLRQAEADFVVAVPMHRHRRFSRGVNAPDLLASELARKLRIPFFRRLLRRVRRTDLQYMLSVQDRKSNVDGAFAVAGKPNAVSGKRILLVDDILTTGATCNEIAGILRRSGAESVTVCVLARAEGIYGDFHAGRG